jgi:hypothetical protein
MNNGLYLALNNDGYRFHLIADGLGSHTNPISIPIRETSIEHCSYDREFTHFSNPKSLPASYTSAHLPNETTTSNAYATNSLMLPA